MQIDKIIIDGPYRDRRRYIATAKIVAVTVIMLIGVITLIRLDTIMTQQADLTYRMVVIQQDLDRLQDVEPEIVDSSQFFLTEDERYLIERICMAEANPQDVVAMAAVAQTIRNRAELWGYTIKEVCLAPSQYASPKIGEVTPEAVQAVWAIFDEGLEVVPGKVTHFHSEKIAEPYWTENKVCRGSVGGNRFYGESAK